MTHACLVSILGCRGLILVGVCDIIAAHIIMTANFETIYIWRWRCAGDACGACTARTPVRRCRLPPASGNLLTTHKSALACHSITLRVFPLCFALAA